MKYNTNTRHQPLCCTEERYPALRSIISWYKFLAWVTVSGAIIVSLLTAFLFDVKQSIPFIMFAMFCGIAGFVNFMAFSEGILVILDIEQNTKNIDNR